MSGDKNQPRCPLCTSELHDVVWQDADWRVVRANEPGFPGFFRVISNHHVAEWTDFSGPQRDRCMDLVVCIEKALRDYLNPQKINLAALGNMVPHLHWHVVARFANDSHFPASVWSSPQRKVDEDWLISLEEKCKILLADLPKLLNAVKKR